MLHSLFSAVKWGVKHRLLELLHHKLQSNGRGRNNNEDRSDVQVSLQQICVHDHIRYPQTVIYHLITRLLNLIRLHSNDTIGLIGQSPLNTICTWREKSFSDSSLSDSALPEILGIFTLDLNIIDSAQTKHRQKCSINLSYLIFIL